MWQVSPATVQSVSAVQASWFLPQSVPAMQAVPVVLDPQQIIPLPQAAVFMHVTVTVVPLLDPLVDPELLPLELPLELPLLEPLELLELLLLPLPLLELLPAPLLPLLHPKSAAATTDTTPTARPMFMTIFPRKLGEVPLFPRRQG
jgi:hypothetical protein